ncbi:hypothetical protein EVG20_g9578 [Dentipellis fragilis]|uniref:Uncharacterized protein n=1 Tax=Dentipellis fragilis TaxID=205917 RepID=A0A4Y9Y1L4_9AGAM|nr:hypothetical protein EVG20_g9578 [Dentipellis fragilis]
MIIPITLPSSDSASTSLPPTLAQIGSSELVLIELQGSLEVEGDKHGKSVGKLTIPDDDKLKPTLLIGYHLIEGKITNLPKPLAVLHRVSPSDSVPSDAMDIDSENPSMSLPRPSPSYTIRAIVRKKLVFSKRPMPMVGLSAGSMSTKPASAVGRKTTLRGSGRGRSFCINTCTLAVKARVDGYSDLTKGYDTPLSSPAPSSSRPSRRSARSVCSASSIERAGSSQPRPNSTHTLPPSRRSAARNRSMNSSSSARTPVPLRRDGRGPLRRAPRARSRLTQPEHRIPGAPARIPQTLALRGPRGPCLVRRPHPRRDGRRMAAPALPRPLERPVLAPRPVHPHAHDGAGPRAPRAALTRLERVFVDVVSWGEFTYDDGGPRVRDWEHEGLHPGLDVRLRHHGGYLHGLREDHEGSRAITKLLVDIFPNVSEATASGNWIVDG